MVGKAVVSRGVVALAGVVFAFAAGCGSKNTVYDAGLDAIYQQAQIFITPQSQNFADTAPNQVAPPLDFEVKNIGLEPSGPINVLLEASADGVFKVINNQCGVPLANEETCGIRVQFNPKAPGEYTARLTVSASPGGASYTMMTGSSMYSLMPALSISPGVADFPQTSTALTAAPPSQPFMISNTGSVPTGPLTAMVSGDDSFAVAENSCVAPSLPPGGMCSVTVRFRPTKSGQHVGTLEIADKANNVKQMATLSGTGIRGAQITLNPPATFPDTAVGLQVSRLFTLVNSGEEATGAIGINTAGDDGDFTLDKGNCALPLPPALTGQTTSCSFKLTFAPKTVGTKNLSVQISASPGGNASFDVSANATLQPPPSLTLMQIGGNPFVNVPVGESRTALYLVSNTGNMMAGKPDATLAGSVNNEFVLVNNCMAELAPQDSCNIQITFTPKDQGTQNVTLLVSASPGGTQAQQITASAQLVIGLLQFSSNGFHDFGTHSVTQQTNTTFTFTLTNRGQQMTGPIMLGPVEGATPGDFTVVGSDCANRQLLTNQTCFLRIRFQPLPPRDLPMFGRTRSASMTVSADPGGKPVASFFGTASN